jgi:hypothetical protein
MNDQTTTAIEVDILSVPNGYGFGYDWSLEVVERGPGNKIYRMNVLRLGQAEKVVIRLLDLQDLGELIDATIDAGLGDTWNEKVSKYVAGRVVEALVLRMGSPTEHEINEALLTSPAWAAAVD